MKKAVLFSAMGALSAWSTMAAAEEVGRVISSTPVIQQVAVPRQICNNQPVAVQQPNSGGGAALGAVVGGLAGNTIGHGTGRAAATLLGVLGGAAVGNSIEGSGNYVQNVPQCSTQTTYENRTVAYNVVYEYGGKDFSVQMPYDPGSTIRLQLTPVGTNAPAPADANYAAAPATAAPGTAVGVIVGQPMVAPAYPVAYPAYPAYYYPRPYYYPPIGLSLGFNFSSGHHHRHWR
jgi:uncharacterized protein YcfJ